MHMPSNQNFVWISYFRMYDTCPTQVILLTLMILTVLGEEHKIIKLKTVSTFLKWKYFI